MDLVESSLLVSASTRVKSVFHHLPIAHAQPTCRVDTSNNLIRRCFADGTIATVAGLPPPAIAGYNGDNIPAVNARLNAPTGVALDSAGNWLITDRVNHCIRLVTVSNGLISTVAGTPSASGT
jgi:hypothetical protein